MKSKRLTASYIVRALWDMQINEIFWNMCQIMD